METRNRFLTPLLGFLFLLLLLFSEHAFAANRVILSSGDWQDPTIWFRNRVGDEKDSVSLERGTTALTSSAEVTNLKVATSRDSSAGRLRVATGAVLSASRDIVIGYSGRGTASLELEKGAVTAGFITLNDGPRRDSGARARLVNAGNLSASSLAIVNANPGGTAEILVSGGAIRIADSLTLSSESGSGGLKINAGRLTWGGLFTLGGKGGHDVLEVTGAAPTISGRHCRFENRAALIFTLDQLGVAPIECADTATLSAAIDSFVIDGSDYTGGPTTVPLLVTGNLNGTFDPRDARITGFDEQAFSIRLTRRANDLVLEIEERESQSAGERTHYGYIYWEHGIPTPLSSRRPASFANLYARENPDLIVQTGHYSLRFDADDIRITGFDLIEGSDYLSALHEDVTRFTPADLRLTISADGVDYFCGEGVVQDSEGFHVRLIESGQFLQRFDHDKVVCKSADGRELGQPVRLEVSAWPDRFTLTLDASRVAGAMRASVEFAGSDGRRYSSASGGATTSVTVQAAGYGPGRALEPGDWIPSASRASDNGSLSTRYSPETGALVIEILPEGNSYPNSSDRYDLDEVIFEVTNPTGESVNLPLVFDKARVTAITGSVMTLSEPGSGAPAGIPVQISKNWHGTSGDTVHRGPWVRASTLIPLAPYQTRRLVLRSIDGYWDATPAASHSHLSLIGYGGNWKWDQAALGAWGESTTLDPTQHLGSAFFADIRPAFTPPRNGSADHGWTENLGGADFLVYFDADNRYRWLKKIKTAYVWTGPNLTRVLYSGITDDDKIRATYTVRMGSTFDYLRRLHGFRYEFLADVDSPRRLVFHQLSADYYTTSAYSEYHVGDASGRQETHLIEPGGDEYKTNPIPFDNRWLVIDDVRGSSGGDEARANRGLIMRALTLNGAPLEAWLHKYGRDRWGGTMLFDLGPDSISRSYRAGDIVEGEVALMLTPEDAASYWGDDAEFGERLQAFSAAWEAMLDEYRHNELLEVVPHAGVLVENYPVTIEAASGNVLADFTVVSGGIGHVPVVVTGVPRAASARAQQLVDGRWVDIKDPATRPGAYYQGYRNAQGNMDLAFTVKRPDVNLDNEWRFRVIEE